jgi:hypothetical protein
VQKLNESEEMLWTNIRNQVRQTPLHRWKPLIPLFEAVMNSFQAIREADSPAGQGRIRIEIEREKFLVSDENPPIRTFKITDNGVGLNDTNFDSFNTAFSEHKLTRGGKGLARFTWLKAFERVEIESVFSEPDTPGHLRRKFVFDENYEPDHGLPSPVAGRSTGTTVRLVDFLEPYKSEGSKSADQVVQALVEHFLLIFLEPGCATVEIHDLGLKHSANEVFSRDFKTTAAIHPFTLKGQPFTLHGFRLMTARASKHKLVYAANQRGVLSDNLADHIPNLTSRLPLRDGGTFVYLGIVQSPFLTERVNPARTDFDLASTEDADAGQGNLFADEIRRVDIRDECLKFVEQDLAEVIDDLNEAKEERIRAYVRSDAPQYKILLKYLHEFINKIPPGAAKADIDTALHRELYQREAKLRSDSTRIIKEADKVDDYEEYHRRFNEFMERYNELGVSALTQYVMHRKIMLDFLERAISLEPNARRYPLERIVHQLIFPMRTTSDDIPYHEQNLWIIDERLTFNSFIASDKPLSTLETVDSDSDKRPDLFVFDRKVVFSEGQQPVGSLITVEFKRPQRDNYSNTDNPVSQSFELVEAIKDGTFKDERGRPISLSNQKIPAFCYIICDLTNSLKKVLDHMDAFVTPDNQGYYGFHRNYGIYWEVMDYNKLLRDAQKRNRIFFEKLNLVSVQRK